MWIWFLEGSASRSSKAIRSIQDAKSRHFGGIEVLQNLVEGTVWIGQPNYVQKLLEKFGMQDSKPVSTPSTPDSKLVKKTPEDKEVDQKKYQAAVGSLLYLSTKTRPDIAFAVGNVAQFCSEPTQLYFSQNPEVSEGHSGPRAALLQHCSFLHCIF